MRTCEISVNLPVALYDIKDVMRKDELEQCLPQEEALSNTKNKENGFFKGPKVIDK